jgi:hypothetical protein
MDIVGSPLALLSHFAPARCCLALFSHFAHGVITVTPLALFSRTTHRDIAVPALGSLSSNSAIIEAQRHGRARSVAAAPHILTLLRKTDAPRAAQAAEPRWIDSNRGKKIRISFWRVARRTVLIVALLTV